MGADRAWNSELARLDHRLEERLLWLRRAGRGDTLGAIGDGEAERLVDSLLTDHEAPAAIAEVAAPPRDASAPAQLTRTAQIFELDEAELDVLVLAVAPELDGRYGRVIGFLNDHAQRPRPSVGLAMSLARAGIGAFLHDGRLVRHGLIELDGDGPLSTRAVRATAGFWPRLFDAPADATAGRLVRDPTPLSALALDPADRAGAAATARWLIGAGGGAIALVVGPAGSGRDALARALALELDRPTFEVAADRLDDPAGVRALAREARWHGAVVVVRGADAAVTVAQAGALDRLPSPVIWIAGEDTSEALKTPHRPLLELRIGRPGLAASHRIWERFVPASRRDPAIELASFAARFPFSPGRIEVAGALAEARARLRGTAATVDRADLEAVSRSLPDSRLGVLARRMPLGFGREDLVVPADTRRELDLIEAWARHGRTALDAWGLSARVTGRGLACLFHGPPGTGKTMGAQVIAAALGLDLYRIDLSQVVSKYIGETEKNLARVFDEAREANAILFFDEADALFGKRTEIKDAHDRNANVETGFLLQRLEQHEGLTILASNLRQNLDAAFLRRLQIIAEFPMPGVVERRRIWEGTLPAAAHREPGIDLDVLARVATSGAEIRNAVVAAALLAAVEARLIGMSQLVRGLWRELRKSGRLVDAHSFGPWADEVLRYAGK